MERFKKVLIVSAEGALAGVVGAITERLLGLTGNYLPLPEEFARAFRFDWVQTFLFGATGASCYIYYKVVHQPKPRPRSRTDLYIFVVLLLTSVLFFHRLRDLYRETAALRVVLRYINEQDLPNLVNVKLALLLKEGIAHVKEDAEYRYDTIRILLVQHGTTGIVRYEMKGRPNERAHISNTPHIEIGYSVDRFVESKSVGAGSPLKLEVLEDGGWKEREPLVSERTYRDDGSGITDWLARYPGFTTPFHYRRTFSWPNAMNVQADAFLLDLGRYMYPPAEVEIMFLSDKEVDVRVSEAFLEPGNELIASQRELEDLEAVAIDSSFLGEVQAELFPAGVLVRTSGRWLLPMGGNGRQVSVSYFPRTR